MPDQVPTPAIYDIAFYASAWLVGALCGLLSTFISHRDSNSRVDAWDLLSIGSLSGFISVAVIGVVVRSAGGTVGSEPYYIAISIACGLLGKNGLKLAYFIVGKLLAKIGVDDGLNATQTMDHSDGSASRFGVDDSFHLPGGGPTTGGSRSVAKGDAEMGSRNVQKNDNPEDRA